MSIFDFVKSESEKNRAEIDNRPDFKKSLVLDYNETNIINAVPEVLEILKLANNNYTVVSRYTGVTDSAVIGWLSGSVPKSDTMEKIKLGIKKLKKLHSRGKEIR